MTDATMSVTKKRSIRVRYLVLAMICLITTIGYVQRNAIGSASKTIQDDLQIDKTALGEAKGAFLLTYALFQIPSGWLVQRWGARRTLAVLAAGWSLAGALAALAHSLGMLLVAQYLMGALQAGIFPCATLVFASWFPATQRGLATGTLNSFMLAGAAIGSFVSGKLLRLVAWQYLFVIYAFPGVLWSLFFYLWFRNRPSEHSQVTTEELTEIGPLPPAAPRGTPIPWRMLLLSSSVFWINAQQFFRAASNTFFGLWFAHYLQATRHIDEETANSWATFPLAAAVVGSFVGGWLSDWILRQTGSRKLARQGLAIGTLLLAISFFVSAYFSSPIELVVLFACCGNFLSIMSSPCSYSITLDMGGRNLAVVFSMMNMAGNLGASAFQRVFGWLTEQYSWDAGLALFAGCYLAGAACLAFLNSAGTIGEKGK